MGGLEVHLRQRLDQGPSDPGMWLCFGNNILGNEQEQKNPTQEGLPWWSSGKESAFQRRGLGFNPCLGN